MRCAQWKCNDRQRKRAGRRGNSPDTRPGLPNSPAESGSVAERNAPGCLSQSANPLRNKAAEPLPVAKQIRLMVGCCDARARGCHSGCFDSHFLCVALLSSWMRGRDEEDKEGWAWASERRRRRR